MKVKGLAALSAGAKLTPYEFERRDCGTYDVAFTITHAGICHSDIHQVDRKSTRLNSSHSQQSRMPSSA